MTYATSAVDQVDHRRGRASVLVNVPGVPWWAAVLIAFVPTAVGIALDLQQRNDVGLLAWILTIAGNIVATLAVRRHAVFTPMVQPPLIVVAALIVSFVAVLEGSLIAMSLRLVNSFPLMVTATAAALLLGMVRVLAQPLTRAPRQHPRH